MYVRLENTSEEEQILNPDWKNGMVEVMEEEPDYPRVEMEEAGLPPVPEGLTAAQKKDLRELLEEYQDVFIGKDFKLGNTGLIAHEVHAKGPLIIQPYRRQNPEIQRYEQEQLKKVLEQEIIRPSSSSWASPVVTVKKKEKKMAPCSSVLISRN